MGLRATLPWLRIRPSSQSSVSPITVQPEPTFVLCQWLLVARKSVALLAKTKCQPRELRVMELVSSYECACVFVCERERDRDRQTQRKMLNEILCARKCNRKNHVIL